MLAFLILGILLIPAGLYYWLLVILSRNPANLSSAAATLTQASGYKNVRGYHGRGIVKNQTQYVYTYTVDGKVYRHKGRVNRHRRTLPQRVTIVYLTRFPRHGGIDAFSAQVEGLLGASLIFQAIVLIAMYFLIQAA